MILLGKVIDRDGATAKVKVRFDENGFETDFIPVVQHFTKLDKSYMMPDLGETVVVGLDESRTHGVVFGAVYSSRDPVPSTFVDKVVLASTRKPVEINGNEHGGLVKVSPLTERLNALENKLNLVLNALKTHIHTSAAPGSPTTPPTPSITIETIALTPRAELENQTIKHG